MQAIFMLAATVFGTPSTAEISAILSHDARRYVAQRKAEALSIAFVRCKRIRYVSAGRPAPATTAVFEIGSLSKLLTGSLLAVAVEAGKVSLDDDVRRYLPPGYANLRWSDGTPVTLGQLVATISGLPDYLPDPAPLARVPTDRQLAVAASMLARYSDADFLRDLRSVTLVARPGTAARHSNVAAQLLGLILSRVYGKPFAELLNEQVERPAGMGAGTIVASGPNAVVGRDTDHRPAPFFTGPSVSPAGGLRYSARDMARFIRLHLSDAAAVRLSHRTLASGPDGDVAFTWLVSEPRPGVRRLRLTGSTFGFSSYIEVYPELGYGIALLANQGGGDVQDELKAMAEHAFSGSTAAACGAR